MFLNGPAETQPVEMLVEQEGLETSDTYHRRSSLECEDE
jgi:hypothetical protein